VTLMTKRFPFNDVRSQEVDLPFISSLMKEDRPRIRKAAAVRPLLADELKLSPLGATIDLAGDWGDLRQLGLDSYHHRAVVGEKRLFMSLVTILIQPSPHILESLREPFDFQPSNEN
jgi:hypothetical protein